jgi:uncharacterized protein YndB with AHSA1/START domain
MTQSLSVERQIFIAASPEIVFGYFVEPALMARWFGKQHTLDPRPGGLFRAEVSLGNIVRGIYKEVAPYRRIAVTWGWEGRTDLPPGQSLVEITLTPKDGGTLVELRHSGLPPSASSPFTPKLHGEKWSLYLSHLEKQCTTGPTHERNSLMNITQERDTTTIRQTVQFNASPAEVYEMIMDSKKHTSLSGEPAEISRDIGGTFTAWGSHLSGVNLVLRPGEKIVQAWRAHDWWPDHYSIVTFSLRKVESGAELQFTQIGVPPHRFDGHSRGWIETYWRPMQELFDKGKLSDRTQTTATVARQKIDEGKHF